MANTINESAIKKLKLIITVVDRNKAEFYLDILSQYEVNFQMVTGGIGTAHTEIVEMLGLNNHKAVILSISFALPLSSVIGVIMYQFLSNNKHGKED